MVESEKSKQINDDAENVTFGYTKPDDYNDGMYDELTGIPSFNLYEDRLQVALTNEKVKDQRMRRLKIAVVGIFIENFSDLSSEKIRRQVLKKNAEALIKALPLNYTVARGINYQFWLMMPYLSTKADAEVMVEKVKDALVGKISDNGQDVRLRYKIGVSLFEHNPDDTVTTLVGKAIYALQKAKAGKKDTVYFSDIDDA